MLSVACGERMGSEEAKMAWWHVIHTLDDFLWLDSTKTCPKSSLSPSPPLDKLTRFGWKPPISSVEPLPPSQLLDWPVCTSRNPHKAAEPRFAAGSLTRVGASFSSVTGSTQKRKNNHHKLVGLNVISNILNTSNPISLLYSISPSISRSRSWCP